jgi:hypothetical protein
LNKRPTAGSIIVLFYLLHKNLSNSELPNWQWGMVKNETLRQKRWFQFSHCWTFLLYVAAFQQHLHMEYISLSWYSRACGFYQDFLDRELLLIRKLLNQGFLLVKLKSSLRQLYDRHHDLVDRYGISVTNDHGYVPLVVNTSRSFRHSWLITGFVATMWINTMGATNEAVAYPSGAPEFTPGF